VKQIFDGLYNIAGSTVGFALLLGALLAAILTPLRLFVRRLPKNVPGEASEATRPSARPFLFGSLGMVVWGVVVWQLLRLCYASESLPHGDLNDIARATHGRMPTHGLDLGRPLAWSSGRLGALLLGALITVAFVALLNARQRVRPAARRPPRGLGIGLVVGEVILATVILPAIAIVALAANQAVALGVDAVERAN
jgi:hypothetical protein